MAAFLLVHGHWHGPWCWEHVEALLVAAGHQVVAPSLPCEDRDAGCAANAQAVMSAAGEVWQRPLVLVGHSAGGMTVPIVAEGLQVHHLVFVAGLLPVPGTTMVQQFETERIVDPDFHYVDDGDGLSHVPPDVAIRCFYQDCAPAAASQAAVRLRRQTLAPLTEISPLVGWPAVPMTYVACRRDRVILPPWQLSAPGERLGMRVVPIDSGHSPMLSQPKQLAEILLEAAL